MPDLEKELDAIAQRALENTLAPSLSVAATKDGEIAYVKAWGEAAPDTVYNIASVTKQFTSACVMMLVRRNMLSLDDPVWKWFPKLTRSADITVRDLLAHASGYPDYYPLGFADEEKLHDTPPEEIVQRYATRDLQFEPRTAWSYSNTGYHIAGLIVEHVTGKPFGEVLEQLVLHPAGMDDSFFNDPPRITPRHARGFTRYCLGPQRESGAERAGWTYASGGIAATARDLAQWHATLMRRALFDERETSVMTTPYVFKDGTASPLALGWFTERRGPHSIIQHNGGIAGFASQTIVSLQERCSVVVLSNGDHVPAGPIASQLFQALLPDAEPPVLPPVEDAAHAVSSGRAWLERLREGTVDRNDLEPEIDAFLTRERLDDARAGLRQAGAARTLTALASGERGGMPWYRIRVEFESGRRADLVFRETYAGRLAEFNAYALP